MILRYILDLTSLIELRGPAPSLFSCPASANAIHSVDIGSFGVQ